MKFNISHAPLLVSKIIGITFSSDLRKPCWKVGKSLSPKSKKCPVLENNHIYQIKQDEKSTYTYFIIFFWIYSILFLIWSNDVCLPHVDVNCLFCLYFTFICSFISLFMYSLGTDVIVQVITGEPLKALMLLCRGNLSNTDCIVQICCSKPPKALMLWCRGALFSFQFWDGKQNLVPNMWQIVFANVSIERRVAYSDVNGFFDGSGHTTSIPSYTFDVFHWCCKPVVLLCSNIGGGAFRCSLYLSSKVLADSPMYSIIRLSPASVTPQGDGTLTINVYRKLTHTDLCLQWDSHHDLACKYSVINTLKHRAKAVCSNSKLLEEELKHPHEVLHQCKYPSGLLTRYWNNKNKEEWEMEESKAKPPARHRRNVTLWYLIPKAYVKATRPFVASMESRYTSRVETL